MKTEQFSVVEFCLVHCVLLLFESLELQIQLRLLTRSDVRRVVLARSVKGGAKDGSYIKQEFSPAGQLS